MTTLTITTGIWPFRKKRTFKGSCTVWHDVKTGKRPRTLTEIRLSGIEWLNEQQQEEEQENGSK